MLSRRIVEPELVVGPVGDVGGVGALTLLVGQAVHDDADGKSEKLVDRAHPLGVAPGQVVVDGHHVHAVAGQRVQVDRQGGDQGLALARLHLGDHALVEHDAAEQLDIEMALSKCPLRRLAHRGERFLEQPVERLAAGQAFTEPARPALELVVAQVLDLRLERVDRIDVPLEPLQDPVILGTEERPGDRTEHGGTRIMVVRKRAWGHGPFPWSGSASRHTAVHR